ncbi:MAG: hypothetical protein WDN30_02800 [Pararobbsia sp.]
MKQLHHIDEIVRVSFGLWISGLFSAISSWNPTQTFEERKEAPFWLIERLLRVGKIRFVAPAADCYSSPDNPRPRFTMMERLWLRKGPRDSTHYGLKLIF